MCHRLQVTELWFLLEGNNKLLLNSVQRLDEVPLLILESKLHSVEFLIGLKSRLLHDLKELINFVFVKLRLRDQLVLISLEVKCAHNVLKAMQVYLLVKHSLDVIKVDFLGNRCINLGLVCLPVKSLCHALFVGLLRKFVIHLCKHCLHLLLKCSNIP